MNVTRIEIECPECGRHMNFYLDTRTDEINRDEVKCETCGKKIQASLEFEEV